jgi:hypothetical protein
VNAATGTMFESPQDLLTIWCLLVLPAVVPREPRADAQHEPGGDGPTRGRIVLRRRPA